MYKATVLLIVFFIALHTANCGIFGRSSSFSAVNPSGSSASASSTSEAVNSGGARISRSSSYVGKRNRYIIASNNARQTTTPRPLTSRDILQQHGISPATLIFIIIAVIVMGFTFYYGVICYPFLCKTERNYQFMDASSTITGATSRSMQSMEHFAMEREPAQKN